MKRYLGMVVLLVACSSSTGRPGSDGGNDGPVDMGPDNDALWAQDPAPMYCALDGGALPPPPLPGGTPDCPDDKNREGCPCTQIGVTAPCWPGLRANRNLGICHDGTTTCTQTGEFNGAWGACTGYQLPTPGATEGASACKCFSHGTWKLDNLSPCFFAQSGQPAGSGGAISTVGAGAAAMCPADLTKAPAMSWAGDTVTVDCEGRFTLCYTLKAGDGAHPMASDCTVAQVCTSGDYVMPNQAQPFPSLPGWLSSSTACTQQFATSGGYGEMSVHGETVMCDMIADHVFNRVTYCPLDCNSANPANPAKCANCMNGGSGGF